MIKKIFFYLGLVLLGAISYHFVMTYMTKSSEIQPLNSTKKNQALSADKKISLDNGKNESAVNSTGSVRQKSKAIEVKKISKAEQNQLVDKMTEKSELLAISPEEKAFFTKQKEVNKKRLSRNFDSKEDYINYFLKDEYDPVWAPRVEQEIDKSVINKDGSSLVEGMTMQYRECKKNFCKLSFSHDVNDKKLISQQQGQFMFKFTGKADVNLHRNYAFHLNEEDMMTYIFIERCLSCE